MPEVARLLEKAILLPSGEKLGSTSAAGSFVSWVWLAPVGVIVKISNWLFLRFEAKAIRPMRAGDHEGVRSSPSAFVRLVKTPVLGASVQMS